MKKHILLILIVICGLSSAHAQSLPRYIVRLKDKGSSPYSLGNPSQFLTARALLRRTNYSIAIDSSDIPVTPRYIDSIRMSGAVTILNTSRWLNQVAILTSDAAALTKISTFPFVASVSAIGNTFIQPVNKLLDPVYVPVPGSPNTPQNVNDYYNYGQSYGQVHLNHGEFLHNHGFHGEGMIMCILDAGFYHYQSLPTFDSVRNNGQILGTWDFVKGNASVNEEHQHGMNCFSIMAANMPGIFMGNTPKASFYLYRTEDAATEYPIEEQNWAAGAEKADSLGVDICSTSLGYNQFDNPAYNHTYADLNGHTTLIARAANFAARKGMLIVVANGNEGGNSWHYILTPADADSALAVGAVSNNGTVAGFSSYGPNSAGLVKPNVAAVGLNAVIANPVSGQPAFGSGTSFACPNMAGLSTCLWQAFPEVNNMALVDILQKSATRASNPDDRVGYGIPDLKTAFVLLIKKLFIQSAVIANCQANIQWNAKNDAGMSFSIERKLASQPDYVLLANQPGSGIFAKKDFSYTDPLNNVPSGLVKYRIKMTIATDTSFYFDSVAVNYVQNCNTERVVINPNPVKDNLYVGVFRNNPVKVSIVLNTSLGQRIYILNNQQAGGGQTYSIPMKEMSRGVYYLTVFIDNKKEVTKKILR